MTYEINFKGIIMSEFTVQKLKSTNSKLFDFIKNHEGELKQSQLLQYLSQALYSKPYEELKETLPNEKMETVYILSHGSAFYFAYKSTLTFLVDFQAASKDVLEKSVLTKIKNKKVLFKHYTLPFLNRHGEVVENDKSNFNDALYLATIMGFINKKITLLDVLDESSLFSINGEVFKYSIDGDWFDKVESEGIDAVIWHIDFHTSNFEYFEYFFTLKDILEAEQISETSWRINENDKNSYIIEILK